jgi:hypothetical protein
VEIPVGFDAVQDQVVQEAGASVALTGQLFNRAQNQFANDLKNIQEIAQVPVAVMEEVRKRQGVALDTATAVAASRAETELTNSTRDRAITRQDLDKFENSIRSSTDGLAKPPGYALASDQAMKKVRATIEANVAERNFKFLRDKEVETTATNISELIRSGKYDLARWAIDNVKNKADKLFTPDQLNAFADRLTVSETHDKLIDIIKSGTPEAIAAGEAYSRSLLTDPSIDASLRDSIYASHEALINRFDADNKTAAVAALRASELDAKQDQADRLQFAQFGMVNPVTGETERMSKAQLDQLKAAGEFDLHPEWFTALSKLVNAGNKKQEGEVADKARMTTAMVSGDSIAYTSTEASDSATTTATKYAEEMYNPFADFPRWPTQDKTLLRQQVNVGYVPNQVGATLDAGMVSSNPAEFDAAVAMADMFITQSPNFWANAVPENQKSFYNTVIEMRNAGFSVTDASEQYRKLVNRSPAEKKQAEIDYKTASGGGTLEATTQANEAWLRDQLRATGSDVLGGENVIGEELVAALDDDPQMSAYVRGQFNALTKHFFLSNGGNYNSARTTAYQQLLTVVRPTNVNGYTEFMLYAPEWRPGVNVPMPSSEIRAQVLAAQTELEGYDQVKVDTQKALAGDTPEGTMYRLTPTNAWKDGYRVFLFVTPDGMPARHKNGEAATWHPDYDAIIAKHAKDEQFAKTVQAAEARNYEHEIDRISKELDKNPRYTGGSGEETRMIDEAKNRRARALNFREPAAPWVNQYPEMFKEGADWAERQIIGAPDSAVR